VRTLLTTRLTDRKQGVAGRRSHELNPVEGLWADLERLVALNLRRSEGQVSGPWWRGRVALVGDAASCVSLFGDGSSLAMAGASTLAEELATNPGDHRVAFRRYEASHRTLVDPRQQHIAREASLLRRPGPASWPGT
jgi:2-polyprenyl-6-methoxyphenol hydroxylase-like FAD-dependent oxidoreductase